MTEGNLDKFMPGFQSLSDRQRWDVVAYTYTLSASADELAQAKTVYDQNCAACHGENGSGNGPQAASLKTVPAAWAKDQSRLSQLSAEDMAQVIANGKGEMPAFADKIDENQRYALAAYLRTLSFSSGLGQAAAAGETPIPGAATTGTPVAQAETPAAGQVTGTPPAAGTAPAAPSTITITGQVTNASEGGKLPDGMKATLLAYQGMDQAFDKSVDVPADGVYRFSDVEFSSDYVYFVSLDANGVTFNSDILHGKDVTGSQASLPVQIYDTSTDASSLLADRMHVFFDFTQPGKVQVVNLYIISNPSDKAIVASEKGKPVVTFALPEGATNLQFQDGALGARYVQTEKGFGDTQGIQPGTGQHQVLFAYDMPYNNKLDLNLTPPLPVDAAIVMVQPGVSLKSSELQESGQRDVQGMSFQTFQSTKVLPAGQSFKISLSGTASTESSGTPASQSANPTTSLLIGLGAFGLVLVAAGGWLYYQNNNRRRAALAAEAEYSGDEEVLDETETTTSLLDAIVALDDLHASGGLPEAAYKQRRSELKARLADAMLREKGA
ncbi:MAG: cytochrome c [Chloroflexi bacterium]|nr:MAG: cytochrome c [Chloroflexota bacterium]